MIEDDRVPEVDSPSIAVPETRLVFRLEPINPNGRYVAIIAAESEDQARQFAADADPFGVEWQNPMKFNCVAHTDEEAHVVGDVVFQSTPPIPSDRKKARTG